MFELFEHTADLGLRVRAADLATLFRDAARGLFAVVVEPEPHGEPIGQRAFAIGGDAYDHLLLDWLGELLYVFDTQHVLLGAFEVSVSARGLEASASVFPLRESEYRLLHEVKAVTYHGLRVEQTPEGWLAEVILDI